MFGLLFSVGFVGIPAFYGMFTVVKHFHRGDPSHGLLFLGWAIVFAGIYSFFFPEPQLGDRVYLAMPGVFAVFVIAGAIAGYLERRKG